VGLETVAAQPSSTTAASAPGDTTIDVRLPG
jgi:hypothetical protein